MANQVYTIVTDRIVQLLEEGTVPWRKPWAGPAQEPKNLRSGRPYRGINVFLLSAAGFGSPWWLTFRQAKARGGHIRKGEHGSIVVFYKDWRPEDRTDDDGRPVVIPVLRYYRVWNVEQCEGIDYPKPDVPTIDFRPIDRCERVVADMPRRPEIRHGEARAWYRPSADVVNMPRPELFTSAEEYYSTLFHELTHSTGHKSRLDRPGIANVQPFGSADYSREELIAEMGAAFLSGFCGIETATIDNSAAYIAGWLSKLRSDRKLVVQAASQAQRAADFILAKSAALATAA
ncbi:MAG: zincin-like metallopeptidase domain-containing protein [Planctomycetota bacterium]|nr:zincin-like metallopeptidase domain-containing protein [Planctomycetota bacterium]